MRCWRLLHSFGLGLADSTAIAQRDVVMPMSNMFHANAWGLPHAAVMIGCKLVFPGPHLDPENVLELLEKEQVTVTGAVPTVWLNLLEALYRNPTRWKFAPGLRTLCAGTAPPESLIRRLDRYGIRLLHLWGMTAELAAQEALFPSETAVLFGPTEAVAAARLYFQACARHLR